jgi:hypothetical protein
MNETRDGGHHLDERSRLRGGLRFGAPFYDVLGGKTRERQQWKQAGNSDPRPDREISKTAHRHPLVATPSGDWCPSSASLQPEVENKLAFIRADTGRPNFMQFAVGALNVG